MKQLKLPLSFLAGIAITLSVVAFRNHERKAGDGYIIEHEKEIAKGEPGAHKGGGVTTAYSFFSTVPDLSLVFRKRILYPGSSIGYHLQEKEEIYYIASGTGEFTINGKTIGVQGGDAILTRPGNSHGLKPVGNDSLVVIINYLK